MKISSTIATVISVIIPAIISIISITINWKAIEKEQYEISEMIVALADILRYIVKNAAGVTTLSRELAWLERYMMLQSLKLGKIPNLEIIVSEDVMGCNIHKLLL